MMKILGYAAVALALCWLPLFVVGTLDPKSNPVGLGLLGVGGTTLILVVTPVLLVVKLLLKRRE